MKTKAAKKTKIVSTIVLIVCILAVGISAYLGAFGAQAFGYRVKSFGEVLNRGLDLQGGVTVLEEITSTKKPTNDTFSNAIEFLNLKINKLGVSETEIRKELPNRISVSIPGKSDAQEMINLITKSGKLTFQDKDKHVYLTGSDVKKAQASFDQNGEPQINLTLTSAGAQKFADATGKLVGQTLYIYMDDDQVSAATVDQKISGGLAQISHMKSINEAQRVAELISVGASPVTLKNVSVETVGPTLGKAAIPQALKASILGLAAIFLFLLIRYRVPGLFASFALVLFILMVLLVTMWIKATLTLPGIAGFLLTIGMAVDANVLIFERTKEELRAGKSVKSAIEAGFNRAFSSILDSNVSTIIAGVVLYYLGSGTVKGFALNLIIGVLISMFSAITITRTFLKLGLNSGIMSKPSMLGVKRG